MASASAKAGLLLWYHTACRKAPAAYVIWRCANKVTSENSLKSARGRRHRGFEAHDPDPLRNLDMSFQEDLF